MSTMKTTLLLSLVALALIACDPTKSNPKSEDYRITGDALQAEYVVFAWNDLGMHCLNPTYDEAVILPPYNTVWAQVVKRGKYPEIVSSGLSVEYSILNNSYSYGKTDAFDADFKQFWDNVESLFATPLENDKGLNLHDPQIHNGLAGAMIAKDNYFVVDGMPVTPVNDNQTWNPFQVADLTVKNSGGTVVAGTHCTVPTSDEINCAKCHGPQPFDNILEEHDKVNGQSLKSMKPVLCASCHGSPALGTSGKGSSGKYLSEAIHDAHASRGAACYDCHPGEQTHCNRSKAHTAEDGNCTACHGAMDNVAGTIQNGRVPWVTEPRCVNCHSESIADVNAGTVLYRNAQGHGGMYCAACHGSPHAQIPSNVESDNYQPTQYQSSQLVIGSCGVCHKDSRGDNNIKEFAEAHGGSSPGKPNACHICHTEIPSTNTALWPHSFAWMAR